MLVWWEGKNDASRLSSFRNGPGVWTHHTSFSKSHKTRSEQKSLQQFLRISFSFCFLFPTAHKGKNSSHKNKSYRRSHRGMRLLHDGAMSHTACKTVKLLQVNNDTYHLSKSNRPDLSHILGIISCVGRRR